MYTNSIVDLSKMYITSIVDLNHAIQTILVERNQQCESFLVPAWTIHYKMILFTPMRGHKVEPGLADTSEMRISSVMRTLREVPNVLYVYKTTLEIRTPL